MPADKMTEALVALSAKADEERTKCAMLYNKHSAATALLVAWQHEDKVVFVLRKSAQHSIYPCEVRKDKKSSARGAAKKWRFIFPISARNAAIAAGMAKVLCSYEHLLSLRTQYHCNCGEAVEAVILEKLGRAYQKDSRPFNEAGDISLPSGDEVQVKWADNGNLTSQAYLEYLETSALA